MTRAEPEYLTRYSVDAETLCWLWTGRRDMRGYGRADRQRYAHRLFYAEHIGPLDGATPLHHLCEVRRCVNPWHLVQLTPEQHAALHPETMERARSLAAEQKLARTHCARGHEWTPENTYLGRADGARQCRACNRDKQTRYRERKRT